MSRKKDVFPFFIYFVAIVIFACGIQYSAPLAYSSEKKKQLPPRGISIAPEFTGIVIFEGEDFTMDLTVTNLGRQDEDIDLMFQSVPKGWKAWIKSFNYSVTGVHVPSDKSKTLTLKAEPDEGVAPGRYTFLIKAQTVDGKFVSSARVAVTVNKKKEEEESRGIDITTSYPVLQGPPDARFEFSLQVKNKTDEDLMFGLGYEAPKNWEASFKPAYEEKYISSLRIMAGQTQTLAVEVKPYPWSKPGKYHILIKVDSPKAKGETTLTVALTGTHKLEVGTSNGLLSLNALRGKEANLSIYVKNSGTAPLSTVEFLSFKPENWKVKFNPEKIEGLDPGELKQVEVTITPADQALVGDYSVNLSARGGKDTKNLELRVTVRSPTTWGWIGIGIIVLVIAGLVVLFITLGRR